LSQTQPGDLPKAGQQLAAEQAISVIAGPTKEEELYEELPAGDIEECLALEHEHQVNYL
jgi:hypothetical protein